MKSRCSKFKSLLLSNQTEYLLEAHNGVSAKIAEEAGFKGIWAGGLALSTSMGVRDNNELSWTQVLDMLEFMSDVTSVPILLDGDTGYGDFNNVRRLVKKLEYRNVSALCIEDNLYPKTNSLLDGMTQPLAQIQEFCGKIKAAKDTQKDQDFCVIARVQAFIAGLGLDEALRRARAYHDAGADAIFIHSKQSNPDEILSFMKEWRNTCPVVIVPTMYYKTPSQVFEDAGVSLVIWANPLIRGIISKMQHIASELHEKKSLVSINDQIASLDEVFRLQDMKEWRQAESRYLPKST